MIGNCNRELRLTKKIANQEKEKRGVKGVKTFSVYIDLIIYINIYTRERPFPLRPSFAFPG